MRGLLENFLTPEARSQLILVTNSTREGQVPDRQLVQHYLKLGADIEDFKYRSWANLHLDDCLPAVMIRAEFLAEMAGKEATPQYSAQLFEEAFLKLPEKSEV
jgi:hypothetical protein